MPPQQRRAHIVEATIPLLLQQGVTVNTRQIAEAAGVAEGTLFRVFESLREIVEAAITEHFSVERLRPRLTAFTSGDTLEDTTRAAIRFIVEDYAETRRIFSTAQFNPHDPSAETLRTNIIQRIDLARSWLSEQFTPYADQLRIPTDLFTHFLTTVAHGYGNRELASIEITVDELTQFVLHGALSEESS